jgi:hypothetical protein
MFYKQTKHTPTTPPRTHTTHTPALFVFCLFPTPVTATKHVLWGWGGMLILWKVWTLAQEQVDELDLSTTLNDGSSILAGDQLAEQMQQAAGEFESVQGTGQSSDSLERAQMLQMVQSLLEPVEGAGSGSAASSGTPLGLAGPPAAAPPPPVAPSAAMQADPFNAGFSIGWRDRAAKPGVAQPPARRKVAEAGLSAPQNDGGTAGGMDVGLKVGNLAISSLRNFPCVVSDWICL